MSFEIVAYVKQSIKTKVVNMKAIKTYNDNLKHDGYFFFIGSRLLWSDLCGNIKTTVNGFVSKGVYI